MSEYGVLLSVLIAASVYILNINGFFIFLHSFI